MTRTLVFMLLLTGQGNTASAHDFLAGYVQHRFDLKISEQHLDVTVQLTFFEDASVHERAHMDRDKDSVVSREEQTRYLEHLEPTLPEGLAMKLNGRDLPLMLLYQPELDLMDSRQVKRARHCLLVHYFTRIPSPIKAGDVLILQDRLWPGVKTLASLQAHPQQGPQLETSEQHQAIWPSAGTNEIRELRIRFAGTPQAPTQDPSLNRSKNPENR